MYGIKAEMTYETQEFMTFLIDNKIETFTVPEMQEKYNGEDLIRSIIRLVDLHFLKPAGFHKRHMIYRFTPKVTEE